MLSPKQVHLSDVSTSNRNNGIFNIQKKLLLVFSGNRYNKLNSYCYCSHLVEQMPPVESLDKTYVIPPNVDRSGT